MKPTKTFWEFSKFFKTCVIVWTGTIFFLSLNSLKSIKVSIGITGFDKFAHLIMYAMYAFLIVFSFKNIQSKKFSFYLYVFLYLFFFGVLLEFLQGILTEKRHPDAKDAIANGFGAIVGIFFAHLVVKKLKKNKLIIN